MRKELQEYCAKVVYMEELIRTKEKQKEDILNSYHKLGTESNHAQENLTKLEQEIFSLR